MNSRGAFVVLVSTSIAGVACAVTMTLLALPGHQAALVLASYVLLVVPLAWSVRRLVRDVRDSSERYRALFDASNDGVLVLDGLTVVECNRTAGQILHRERPFIAGCSLLDFCPARQPDGEETAELAERLRAAASSGHHPAVECSMLRNDGSAFDAEIALWQVEYGGNQYMQAVIRDISDRKKADRARAELEENLRWAQKMEAVGALAGGVAHDFNNLMHAVTGYADLLLLNQDNQRISPELLEIKQAAHHASALTRQLLLFGRRAKPEPQRLELNIHVRQVSKMLRRTIPKMVGIDLRLAPDLKLVLADPGQVEQVLINLALNAGDAMPNGGQLTISTDDVVIEAANADASRGLAPGAYVRLSVTDNGQGMDAKTAARVFEPFFTTKDPDKGSGLGLAMVYGIVKAHDGQITCTSEPGVGTTFDIYLPVLEPEATAASEDSETDPPPGGNETVLLVDDEPQVRSVGEQLLSAHGYEVVQAATGEEALERLRQTPDAVDLVILDYIMPGMGGRRCLECLRGLCPNLPVVISSGYSAEATADDLLREGATAFVSKPYQAKTLLRLVREVLDGSRASVDGERQPVPR